MFVLDFVIHKPDNQEKRKRDRQTQGKRKNKSKKENVQDRKGNFEGYKQEGKIEEKASMRRGSMCIDGKTESGTM